MRRESAAAAEIFRTRPATILSSTEEATRLLHRIGYEVGLMVGGSRESRLSLKPVRAQQVAHVSQ